MARQSFNTFTIKGYLGSDAEARTYGPKNLPVCEFSLAGNMSRNDTTIWFRCVLYRQVNSAAELLKRGMSVTVSGQLDISPNPNSNDGVLRHSIIVDRFEVNFPPQNQGQQYPSQQQPQSQPQQFQPQSSNFDPFASI